MAIQSRSKRTNKKTGRSTAKPATPVKYETRMSPELLARELRELADQLGEAQDNFLAYRAAGGGDDDGLELLGKLWSVRQVLQCDAQRLLEGAP